MPHRYVPLVRSKAGEVQALSQLSAQARQRVLPLMHLTAQVPARFVNKMAIGWAGRPLAFDGRFSFAQTGSAIAFNQVYRDLEQQGILVQPSIPVGAPTQYQTAVHRAMGRSNRGVAVKADLADLTHVTGFVTGLGAMPSDVDLVVNVGHIGAFPAAQFQRLVTHALQNDLPTPNAWRSVTLAAAAAPKHLGDFTRGRTDVPRLDWSLWNNVHPHAPCDLDYGDYVTLHPDLEEPPGIAAIRATVSVRYALDNEWAILKGVSTSGQNSQPMGQQFRAHARALTRDPNFGGLQNCWADQRVQQIAGGQGGTGNRQSWVEIAVNRHISLVANRLP